MFVDRRRRRIAGVLLAGALLALAAVAPVSQAATPTGPKVMSRNLYLGASLQPALDVIANPSGNPLLDQLRLADAVYDIYGNVQATNFNVRVEALANEIQRYQPMVIGLQEAAKWCVQPPSFSTTANCDDTGGTITYDFQQQLVDELASRGLGYTVAVSQEEADIEGTAIPDQTISAAFDVQLIQRDAILVRTGAAQIVDTHKAHYSVNAPFGPYVSKRGWVSADLKLGPGKGAKGTFRAVNTHLEAFSNTVRDLQAAELAGVNGPLSTSVPLVLTGDMNATTSAPAYATITGAGMSDVAALAGSPGNTCCHDDLVQDPNAGFTERIDYVFTRPALPARAAWATVTGSDPSEIFGGLWASDHGGVVGSIKPPGQ